MTRTTLLRLLPLACALGLLAARPGLGQTQARLHDGATTPPVELSEIAISYYIQNEAGQFNWETPQPAEPNAVPAGAQKIRITARVNNRPSKSTIRIRATLQEQCPSPDAGKNYLARLRHLTESDATGKQTADRADDELREVQSDGRVTIEIPVHCDECVHASCGRECPDRDHLGEGPHVITVTTSDPQSDPAARARGGRAASSNPAKPSSFRLDIMSVCPRTGAKRPGS